MPPIASDRPHSRRPQSLIIVANNRPSSQNSKLIWYLTCARVLMHSKSSPSLARGPRARAGTYGHLQEAIRARSTATRQLCCCGISSCCNSPCLPLFAVSRCLRCCDVSFYRNAACLSLCGDERFSTVSPSRCFLMRLASGVSDVVQRFILPSWLSHVLPHMR